MAIFNQTELDNLERRDFQLSILAAVIVLVLAGGVALLMYPLVFVHPDEANKWTLRFAFLGFCVLSLLLVAYLLDRQRTMRGLKQQLVAELQRNLELRNQGNVDLLHTIPDLQHFQDRLVMEHRRAVSTQRTLSLLVVKVKLPDRLLGKNEETAALGEAARAIARHLRQNDSMYLLGPGFFGLVLPDTDGASANQISLQLGQTLRAVGAKNSFSFETSVCNYPEHVKSAHELEQTVLGMLPDNQPLLEGVDTR